MRSKFSAGWNDLEWVCFPHMLELTGFPGIEVIVSLCFTLLLIT